MKKYPNKNRKEKHSKQEEKQAHVSSSKIFLKSPMGTHIKKLVRTYSCITISRHYSYEVEYGHMQTSTNLANSKQGLPAVFPFVSMKHAFNSAFMTCATL